MDATGADAREEDAGRSLHELRRAGPRVRLSNPQLGTWAAPTISRTGFEERTYVRLTSRDLSVGERWEHAGDRVIATEHEDADSDSAANPQAVATALAFQSGGAHALNITQKQVLRDPRRKDDGSIRNEARSGTGVAAPISEERPSALRE